MKYSKEKGITLIALVITIIVLLILAGVSIAMLTGDNGILSQAQNAKKKTELASEKEAIQLSVPEYQLANEEKYKLGTTLYDKNADNSTIWDLFVNNNENKTYGTGWNYISKGTNIESYGPTQNEWLVNYETGEIIQIDDNYTHLTHGDNIGVTDGLIFNLDPSIIDTTNIEDLKSGNYETLWKDTTLNGFNWTNDSGLTSKEFNFDGIDDYITVKYDSEEQKNTLAQNGFTFEYYGTIDKGNSYNENKEIINYKELSGNDYTGIFCYWNGNENQQAKCRFGILNQKSLYWNMGLAQGNISDFSQEGAPWNINYPINYNLGNEIYYTITLDTTNIYKENGGEYYKQTIYLNGEKFLEGRYNKKQWDNFINNELANLNTFCIGRSSMAYDGWWHYSKMNAYTLRLYNHALSSDEVKENYQKSVAYHENL